MVLAQEIVDAATDVTESQTTGTDALIAIGAIVLGFVLGALLASVVRKIASNEARSEMIQAGASALATLIFSIVLITALVTALGIVNPASLDALSEDLRSFIPRILSAAIVVILANVIAELSAAGVERSLAHLSPGLQKRVPMMLKFGILGFALIVASDQLGVNTTIITVIVAALVSSLGLAAALLAGLGGRGVARELAAGRALRQLLSVGDTISVGDLNGVVAAIGSTTTQITTTNRVVLVPNNDLLSQQLTVAPDDVGDPAPTAPVAVD